MKEHKSKESCAATLCCCCGAAVTGACCAPWAGAACCCQWAAVSSSSREIFHDCQVLTIFKWLRLSLLYRREMDTERLNPLSLSDTACCPLGSVYPATLALRTPCRDQMAVRHSPLHRLRGRPAAAWRLVLWWEDRSVWTSRLHPS